MVDRTGLETTDEWRLVKTVDHTLHILRIRAKDKTAPSDRRVKVGRIFWLHVPYKIARKAKERRQSVCRIDRHTAGGCEIRISDESQFIAIVAFERSIKHKIRGTGEIITNFCKARFQIERLGRMRYNRGGKGLVRCEVRPRHEPIGSITVQVDEITEATKRVGF